MKLSERIGQCTNGFVDLATLESWKEEAERLERRRAPVLTFGDLKVGEEFSAGSGRDGSKRMMKTHTPNSYVVLEDWQGMKGHIGTCSDDVLVCRAGKPPSGQFGNLLVGQVFRLREDVIMKIATRPDSCNFVYLICHENGAAGRHGMLPSETLVEPVEIAVAE